MRFRRDAEWREAWQAAIVVNGCLFSSPTRYMSNDRAKRWCSRDFIQRFGRARLPFMRWKSTGSGYEARHDGILYSVILT